MSRTENGTIYTARAVVIGAAQAPSHGMGVLVRDGKILAVGIGIGDGHGGIDFALYRYTTNGVLDGQFGGGEESDCGLSRHGDGAKGIEARIAKVSILEVHHCQA